MEWTDLHMKLWQVNKLYLIDYGKLLLFEDNTEYINPINASRKRFNAF